MRAWILGASKETGARKTTAIDEISPHTTRVLNVVTAANPAKVIPARNTKPAKAKDALEIASKIGANSL